MRAIITVWLGVLLLATCKKITNITAEDHWADYRKGYNFLSTNKDSAFFYFNRSATNSADKEQVALAYYNMALIQEPAGDYYGAQESLTNSLKSLDTNRLKDWGNLARIYNELGMTCSNLNSNTDALGYYNLALHYDVDKNIQQYLLNNQGNSYRKLKLYNQALESYSKVFRIIGKTGSMYSRALTNMALTQWMRGRHYNPAPALRQALKIREQEKDSLGENSSFAHLSDFYRASQPDSALYFARRMLDVARRIKSPEDELEALEKLIVLSPQNYIKTYFIRYRALSDSLQSRHNSAKNQFALIRYNVQKDRAENLELQRENAEERYQLIGVVIIAMVGSVAVVVWYRKRKQGMALQARQRELSLSQKIHDVVANGLYVVMSDLENQDGLQKGPLLDRIELLYEQSRDISYDQPGNTKDQFHERIKKLIATFAGPETNIALVGNNSMVWEKVNLKVRPVLEQVIQELMVNMKKHSRATSVALRFELDGNHLQLFYTDNGAGFPTKVSFGNGLTNTGNRIRDIGGMITFDTETAKGIKIYISLPLT